MSYLSVKRQRANTNGDTVVSSSSPDDVRKIIATLDESTIRDLLLSAAINSSQVAAQIVARRNDIVNSKKTTIIDFDHFSKSVCHERGGSRGSKQYDLGLEASVTIEDIIAQIKEQTPSHSSFDTKKSALVTLRKIAKTIVLSNNDTMGHEVINQLHQDGEHMDTAMHYIVDGMSEDEKDKMRSDQEWIDEVKELVELGRNYDMYKTLNQLLENLGVGEVDDRFQKLEMDLETVERSTPAKQARNPKKARAPRRDM
ncbi:hypothetical protein IMSHALPRED_001920 [Imshaugia aleurites]|uniref:Uncharacterized protein n=1 Tax=Imshaugia aleurites TaxID=172621 RepID=A0A8H3EXI4_9LECA|nr:hypothetical protein IMSHALPRED_001920 [Imshaugia aleurites]